MPGEGLVSGIDRNGSRRYCRRHPRRRAAAPDDRRNLPERAIPEKRPALRALNAGTPMEPGVDYTLLGRSGPGALA